MIIITGCSTAASTAIEDNSTIPFDSEEIYFYVNLISNPPKYNNQEYNDALVYPLGARYRSKGGYVLAEAFINKNGFIDHIQILEEDPKGYGFAKAVVSALNEIQFTPGMNNGVPVAVRIRFIQNFTIKKRGTPL